MIVPHLVERFLFPIPSTVCASRSCREARSPPLLDPRPSVLCWALPPRAPLQPADGHVPVVRGVAADHDHDLCERKSVPLAGSIPQPPHVHRHVTCNLRREEWGGHVPLSRPPPARAGAQRHRRSSPVVRHFQRFCARCDCAAVCKHGSGDTAQRHATCRHGAWARAGRRCASPGWNNGSCAPHSASTERKAPRSVSPDREARG